MFGKEENTMTTAMILRTIFEILLVGFALYALFNEDKFAAVERRIFAHLRRKTFKVVSSPKRSYNDI